MQMANKYIKNGQHPLFLGKFKEKSEEWNMASHQPGWV